MYADNLVLISPSTRGLFRLIAECQKYGIEFDILYDHLKSAVMFIKPKFMSELVMPTFKLCNQDINIFAHGKTPTRTASRKGRGTLQKNHSTSQAE